MVLEGIQRGNPEAHRMSLLLEEAERRFEALEKPRVEVLSLVLFGCIWVHVLLNSLQSKQILLDVSG